MIDGFQAYRLHPPLSREELSMLSKSIQTYGVLMPVVVDEHGHTIDGHERQAICRELGVRCPRRIVKCLSEEEKVALVFQLNWGAAR